MHECVCVCVCVCVCTHTLAEEARLEDHSDREVSFLRGGQGKTTCGVLPPVGMTVSGVPARPGQTGDVQGAPLSRLQAQGPRAGRRGSCAAGGQAGREGRRLEAGRKVCLAAEAGTRPGDVRPGPQSPQLASESCSAWVSRDRRCGQGRPATPSLHAHSLP